VSKYQVTTVDNTFHIEAANIRSAVKQIREQVLLKPGQRHDVIQRRAFRSSEGRAFEVHYIRVVNERNEVLLDRGASIFKVQ
jgi:tRNA G18 (ribose-2'-O)-methylase SpoU